MKDVLQTSITKLSNSSNPTLYQATLSSYWWGFLSDLYVNVDSVDTDMHKVEVQH